MARTTRQDATVGRTKSGRKTTSVFVRQSTRNLDSEMDTRNKRRLMQGARQVSRGRQCDTKRADCILAERGFTEALSSGHQACAVLVAAFE